MTVCDFNYKYLKENATPGSWRRGYEYHQKEQVAAFEVSKTGVKAKVKGNFKSFYDVELKFKKNGVEPTCSCPLKEKWCKHAIAVAMKAIDDHVYEEFLERRFKITPDYSDTQTEMNPNPQGGYIFHFNAKRRLEDCWLYFLTDKETGIQIELTYNDETPKNGYDIGTGFGYFAFSVKSLDEFTKKLKENGYKYLYEPFDLNGKGSMIAFIQDPDGYEIEIIEKVVW